MVEQTHHKLLSTVVNELLRPLLAVMTPHVRLHKQLCCYPIFDPCFDIFSKKSKNREKQ